jgi:hypothetical protein
MRHPASPLNPVTLKRALEFVLQAPATSTVLKRVEQVAKWSQGRGATPLAFTMECAPLNILVTLVLHSPDEWEKVKSHIAQSVDKVTWKNHDGPDRRTYMREYMRQYRRGKVAEDEAP